MLPFRFGQGVDVHLFEDGIPLMLGGVSIPFFRGLKGHSDGDALSHAIADALLSACGLEDVGTLYPSSEPKWQGISGTYILEDAGNRVRQSGFVVAQVDATILCDRPNLHLHLSKIQNLIKEILNAKDAIVSMKAKHFEQSGWFRKECLLVFAHVILEQSNNLLE